MPQKEAEAPRRLDILHAAIHRPLCRYLHGPEVRLIAGEKRVEFVVDRRSACAINSGARHENRSASALA